jgi:hypothetical protein
MQVCETDENPQNQISEKVCSFKMDQPRYVCLKSQVSISRHEGHLPPAWQQGTGHKINISHI